LQKALSKHTSLLSKDARKLYENKEQIKLIELLDTAPPMVAVLLNIDISLVNPQLMEQGSTLSHTLLPYINQITDF
jgi:hypothetical protein